MRIVLAYLAFSLDANASIERGVVLRRIVDLQAVSAIHSIFPQTGEIFLVDWAAVEIALGVIYKTEKLNEVAAHVSGPSSFTFDVRLPLVCLPPE